MYKRQEFLVATRHPWAVTYNDVSVNENRHVSRAIALAEEVGVAAAMSAADWQQVRRRPFVYIRVVGSVSGTLMWCALGAMGAVLIRYQSAFTATVGAGALFRRPLQHPPGLASAMYAVSACAATLSEQRGQYSLVAKLRALVLRVQVRRTMVALVLATDMSQHFSLLAVWRQRVAAEPDFWAWADRSLVLVMLLHLADIVNPARPPAVALRWGHLITREFAAQVRRRARISVCLPPLCHPSMLCSLPLPWDSPGLLWACFWLLCQCSDPRLLS